MYEHNCENTHAATSNFLCDLSNTYNKSPDLRLVLQFFPASCIISANEQKIYLHPRVRCGIKLQFEAPQANTVASEGHKQQSSMWVQG